MHRHDERTGENTIGPIEIKLSRLGALALILVLGMAGAGCSSQEGGTLEDLQVVGIDYELGSMILTNVGASDVRTDGLWVYQNGESSEINIFTIEPRATILFSLREVGGADPSGGEIALFSADSFDDPEVMIDYVTWGAGSADTSSVASEAGLWGPDESVDVPAGTAVILRADQAAIGADSWIVEDGT